MGVEHLYYQRVGQVARTGENFVNILNDLNLSKEKLEFSAQSMTEGEYSAKQNGTEQAEEKSNLENFNLGVSEAQLRSTGKHVFGALSCFALKISEKVQLPSKVRAGLFLKNVCRCIKQKQYFNEYLLMGRFILLGHLY